jgi:hypothetical protein
MRSSRKSPSEKFVSEVTSFVAGQHLYGKPRPSTLDLLLESRKLARQTKRLRATYGLDGKAPRAPVMPSIFDDAWDTFMAYVGTILLAALRIVIFLIIWGLAVMATPTIIRHL